MVIIICLSTDRIWFITEHGPGEKQLGLLTQKKLINMFNLTVKWTALKNLLYMAFHIYKTAGQQILKNTIKIIEGV